MGNQACSVDKTELMALCANANADQLTGTIEDYSITDHRSLMLLSQVVVDLARIVLSYEMDLR